MYGENGMCESRKRCFIVRLMGERHEKLRKEMLFFINK